METYWSSYSEKDNSIPTTPEIPDPLEKHIREQSQLCPFSNCVTNTPDFYKSRKDNKYSTLENSISFNKNNII